MVRFVQKVWQDFASLIQCIHKPVWTLSFTCVQYKMEYENYNKMSKVGMGYTYSSPTVSSSLVGDDGGVR